MNRVIVIASAEDHALVTWLFREVRRGRFPAAYALIRADPDTLMILGAEVEASCGAGALIARKGVVSAARESALRAGSMSAGLTKGIRSAILSMESSTWRIVNARGRRQTPVGDGPCSPASSSVPLS